MTWRKLAAGAFVAGITSVLVLLRRRSEDDGFLGLDWLPVELTKSYWTPVPQLIWSSAHEGWCGRATLVKPLSDPERHLFTSNLLFMVTRLDTDGERVLLAVFTTPELREESPSHDKADCPVRTSLEGGTSTCQSVLQDFGDGEVESHVAVDGKGRIWRLAPQDFTAFRNLARTAKAEIGDITSYTVASGEDCTPVFFFIYPVPPSFGALSDNAVNRAGAAMVNPVYRDIHGGTTGDAGGGYNLLHDVDINAYTISCRKLARAQSSSAGSGEARDAMPGELPEALHELLGLAQKWPEDREADDETGDGTDSESLRATVACVERIRSWALKFRFPD
ncbi:uncharacterized protein SCHCODRAFT_02625259 [Schizophyllum commune H4-8]|nr:uncharacterized protein SCHCODRAFT_02625259 [Schizophyllum commune H4-8]KAI5892085.1 hypothetical protein SCHCODRAFT_02625259 [Schizophyllum commune H4-8]